MSELLTVGQAATLAGVSVRTMRRRVAAGEVMTAGHGQARRIVAASVAAASAPGDPATGGQVPVTPATVTAGVTVDRAAMTESTADVTADNAATGPAMAGLVALVDRLMSENRELSRPLVDISTAATLWQERARVLGEQLALAVPESTLEPSGVPERLDLILSTCGSCARSVALVAAAQPAVGAAGDDSACRGSGRLAAVSCEDAVAVLFTAGAVTLAVGF